MKVLQITIRSDDPEDDFAVELEEIIQDIKSGYGSGFGWEITEVVS